MKQESETTSGMITEIQRASIHDGPGIRTVVFLKGCNLRCFWCHNPEAIASQAQLSYNDNKCQKCGRCFSLCANRAHRIENDRHVINWESCVSCLACVDGCLPGALSACGEVIGLDGVMSAILEDKVFYDNSGGGVTLSGGEPMMQPDFVRRILSHCRATGIHTAMESNLAAPWRKLETMLPLLNLVMADIKHCDDEFHLKGTGVSNRGIMENVRKLSKYELPVILRTPVIPGFNDTPAQIAKIAAMAGTLPNLQYYELLRYHPLGCRKALICGMTGREIALENMSRERWEELINAAVSTGTPVMANGQRI